MNQHTKNILQAAGEAAASLDTFSVPDDTNSSGTRLLTKEEKLQALEAAAFAAENALTYSE